jgi:hypothetical protein
MNAIGALRVPDDYVFLVDMGLLNAGWNVARVGLFDTQEVIGEREKFCWAREPHAVQIISRNANPNHQAMLHKIYEDGSVRATSDRLISILDELFQLVGQKSYFEIDLLLRTLDPKMSAPEYFVGLLRATSKEVRHLPSWPSLFNSVKTELRTRGIDPDKILIGLS